MPPAVPLTMQKRLPIILLAQSKSRDVMWLECFHPAISLLRMQVSSCPEYTLASSPVMMPGDPQQPRQLDASPTVPLIRNVWGVSDGDCCA